MRLQAAGHLVLFHQVYKRVKALGMRRQQLFVERQVLLLLLCLVLGGIASLAAAVCCAGNSWQRHCW